MSDEELSRRPEAGSALVAGSEAADALESLAVFAAEDGQPDMAARLLGACEAKRERGGNPFMDYSLPEAILKFKQGFGRLVRSKHDAGTVVVLDSRIAEKRYGKQFIDALPKVPVLRESEGIPW